MWYIPLSSHFRNPPELNAPLCNFICSCMGGFGLGSFHSLESHWKQFCFRVPRFVIWHQAESCDFPLETSFSKRDWHFLAPDWVCSPPAALANPPPREGATANWISGCVVTFLLHWSRRSISELWQRGGQARLGECQGREEEGEEQKERTVRINAGEDKAPKLAWRGLAVSNRRGTSPLTLRMGPKDLSKGQTLGWGLRAWVIGWIKEEIQGWWASQQYFLERKKSLQKSCPDLSLLLCSCPELTGLLPKPERIFLDTQNRIMLVIVWVF